MALSKRIVGVILHAALALILVYCLLILHIVIEGRGDALFPADCSIVFGASVHKGSMPGPAITRRVKAPADLYRAGKIRTIILTGGKGTAELDSEATVMRRVALQFGVDPEDIVTEDRSTSTWENLQFSRDLVSDCSSVVFFSDWWHLGRIKALAVKQGWKDISLEPVEPFPPKHWAFGSLRREAMGLIYYGLKDIVPGLEKLIEGPNT